MQHDVENSEQVVNTDTDEVRIERALNQFDFYQIENPKAGMSDVFGLPLTERMIKIRSLLYPTENNQGISFKHFGEKGVAPTDVYSRKKIIFEAFYVLPELIPDLLSKIEHIVNTVYQTLEQVSDEQQREDITFRLVAFLEVLGIYLHTFIDGNGQTLQSTGLSYLHEFVPRLRNSYFPIKYSDTVFPVVNRFPKLRLKLTKVPPQQFELDPNNTHYEADIQLLELRKWLGAYQKYPSDPTENARCMEEVMEQIKSHSLVAKELQNKIDMSSSSDLYEVRPALFKAIYQLLVEHGYSKVVVDVALRGQSKLYDMSSYHLYSLLNDTQAVSAMIRSIVDGETQVPGTPSQNAWDALKGECLSMEQGIRALLEDPYLCSREALMTQKAIALHYQEVLPRIRNAKKKHPRWMDKILGTFEETNP